MTSKGFERALLSFTRRRPFLPFEIQLITGDQIRIVHPEAVQIRGNIIFHVAPNGRQRLFDSTSVCQLRDDEPDLKLPSMDDD
jgi:hypothetical protein